MKLSVAPESIELPMFIVVATMVGAIALGIMCFMIMCALPASIAFAASTNSFSRTVSMFARINRAAVGVVEMAIAIIAFCTLGPRMAAITTHIRSMGTQESMSISLMMMLSVVLPK